MIFRTKNGKEFDTYEAALAEEEKYEAELAEAEAQAKKLTETRKERADEIKAAYTAMQEASAHYEELVTAFIRDYGSYHMSCRTEKDADNIIKRFFRID